MSVSDMDNESLPQKVDYDLDSHLILGRQKKWKKIIEWIITIIGWLVMLMYVSYVIYGNIALRNGWEVPNVGVFSREMLLEVDKYYIILFVLLLLSLIGFMLWKKYNRDRFGSYRRREFRPDVGTAEIAEKFGLSEEQVKQMQSDRITVLEHNIIPEELGMGKK
ncbi:MAG: poly-beta-1,6-N-acetyl-D-glucosamine biosynthesis protein PgaD [Eubacterium sp.]|nr:poly-beta-1,6-N-acetyl-D-glucosamine biosynthesis protein PgaD [Eubacterium sp.]